MKKMTFVLSFVMLLGACKKMNEHHKKLPLLESEQSITVASGDNATLVLPFENTDDPYTVLVASSQGGNVAINNNNKLLYSAPSILSGMTVVDEIVVTNEHDGMQTGGCMGGGANGQVKHEKGEGPDQHYKVNLHITVTNSVSEKIQATSK